MARFYRFLLLMIFVSTIAACDALAAPIPPTETPLPPSDTPTLTDTPVPPTDTATLTSTVTATETPEAATIPPILTNIPGIQMTLTAAYSTPGFVNTQVAQQTMRAATLGAGSKGLSNNLLSQCPDPGDPPMQTWLDIPVMPQATAGQEVQTLIGSYYCFRAPVTTQDADAFYKAKLTAPIWQLLSDANGTMEFIGLSQAGMQILFLVYGESSKNDLLVAINVTRPIGIPTLKP